MPDNVDLVPTILVTLKESGEQIRINEADFDDDLHEKVALKRKRLSTNGEEVEGDEDAKTSNRKNK